MPRALTLVTWFSLVMAWAAVASAHELEVDQLSLWPDPEAGVVRGQLLCAPELSRNEDDPVDDLARARVLEFARAALDVRVDGARLPLTLRVRELWVRGGAVPGDSVTLEAPLPEGSKELTVRAPESMDGLLVEVSFPGESREVGASSVLLNASQESPPFALVRERRLAAGSSGFERFLAYLWLGIRHIVPLGVDHVAFVVALVLGAELRLRRLIWLLSGFTLAHTVTLGLGATGVLVLPPEVVEPLIALSIAVVAFANLRFGESQLDAPLVLAFGLLHGFGFAGALGERGIEGSVWLPLSGFNLGVELGQLVVVAVTWFLLVSLKSEEKRRRFVRQPALLAIGILGAVWTVERLVG